MIRCITLCTVLLAAIPGLQAQLVQNVTAKVVGDYVEVTYDLPGDGSSLYEVKIYSSYDNYRDPLVHVQGDVGPRIQSGYRKSIRWDYRNANFTNYDVTFRVVATSMPNTSTPPDRPALDRNERGIYLMFLAGYGRSSIYQNININGSIGYKFSRGIGLGVGLGMNAYFLEGVTVPIYLEATGDFNDGPIRLFYIANMGIAPGTYYESYYTEQGGYFEGGFFMQLAPGIKLHTDFLSLSLSGGIRFQDMLDFEQDGSGGFLIYTDGISTQFFVQAGLSIGK
ncbi:MAG: hypothetical protein OHK0039_07420 [Bacteroidia bacterium]